MTTEPAWRISGLSIPDVTELFGFRLEEAPAEVPFTVDRAAPTDVTWTFEAVTLEQAAELLADQQQALARAAEDLDQVELALGQLAQQHRAATFAVPTSRPEAELLAAVRELEVSEVSYGLQLDLEKLSPSRQWQAFVEQVRRLVADYARVETIVAGRPVGQTWVSWTGDMATSWEQGCTADMMDLHRQAVHQALSSRISFLRLISVIVSGATGLLIKAAVPGGQLLLLPAVWKYVREVFRTWSEMRHEAEGASIRA